MKSFHSLTRLLLLYLPMALLLHGLAMGQCGPITLVPIATGFNGMIGIDHYEPTNQLLVSVNYSWGHPNNLELIAANGAHTQYSPLSDSFDELKVATAKNSGNGFSIGGFQAGTMVTATINGGEIIRIAPGGNLLPMPWVACPGEPGQFRGSFYFDRTGVWNGDLIAVTHTGGVWRVNNAGVPTFLANLNAHLEGLITIPNNPAKWGPWAGKILVGSELETRLYTVDLNGNTVAYELGIEPEDLDLIPANENFYGVDYQTQTLRGAPASEFTCMVGDLLITQEHPGISWHVWWDGNRFQKESIAQVSQWEHVTFSTAGVNPISAICQLTATCSKPVPPAYRHGFDNICGYGGNSSVNLTVTPALGTAPFTYAWSGPGTITNGNTATATVTPPCPATSGGTACHTYTVFITDSQGCTASCSISISSININCIGNTNNGNNSNNTGQSGNGVIQSVNAQQHITICHVPPGNGNIGQIKCLPVPAINDHLANHPGDYLGGCGVTPPNCGSNKTSDSDAALVPYTTLEMKAFPNPTAGMLNVTMGCSDCEEVTGYQLRLTDSNGRVLEEHDGQGTLQLDLSRLAAGTYFLSLEGGSNGRLVQRIVKQ